MEPAGGRSSSARTPDRWIPAFAWAGGVAFVVSLVYFLYAYLVVFGRPASSPGWFVPAALNVALFTSFALHHSLFARTGLKAWVRRITTPALERPVYVWTSSVLFLGVCWLWRPVPGELYRLDGMAALAVGSVQAVGILLTALGARALDILDLAGIRQASPDPPPARTPLQRSGVYGIVRHPLYFGWALLVFGTPHMTLTRFTFALISTLYLMAAIPWEERSLREDFGPAYADYQRQVRWRMLPFLY